MKGRKIILCIGLGVAAVAGLGCYWLLGDRGADLTLHGTVEIQEVRLSSKIGGRIAEVRTREGELVQAGQVLVHFEAPELEAQREQLHARVQSMTAAVDKARNGAREEEKEAADAAAEAAQARYERLKAGSRIEEIRQAEADLKKEEATLAVAKREFSRNDLLLSRNAGSATDYDNTKAEQGRSLARVAAAKARLDLLVAGSRKEDIDEAAAALKQARANALLLHNGNRSEDIVQAEAALGEAVGKLHEIEAQLQEATVRAPEPAVIEVLSVRKGDVMAPNQCILRVLRADDLWVKVYVPETELGRIQLGQGVTVTIDSYPGKRFTGTVEQIASESEYTPRNVQSVDERRHQVFGVKVRVADPDGVFKSGMAADVVLPLRTRTMHAE
jgi:multidrug resistance efflux pump